MAAGAKKVRSRISKVIEEIWAPRALSQQQDLIGPEHEGDGGYKDGHSSVSLTLRGLLSYSYEIVCEL